MPRRSVDRPGATIGALRADNARPTSMENARRNAYIARGFCVSTAAYAKRFAEHRPGGAPVGNVAEYHRDPGRPAGQGRQRLDRRGRGLGLTWGPRTLRARLDKVAEQLK